MSEAEAYLRELRRALPAGCRRRLVAEVREHFASAIAAEGARGLQRPEAERLTIERLGPAEALAAELLADLRSGALGRTGRLAVALTTTRVIAVAAVVTVAIVAGAVFAGRRSSPAPPPPRQAAAPPRVVYVRGKDEVRALVLKLQSTVHARYTPAGPRARDGELLLIHPVAMP